MFQIGPERSDDENAARLRNAERGSTEEFRRCYRFRITRFEGELLGVSARTVGRWIRSGRLRGRVTEGGKFRVTRDEVERLAAEQEERALQPESRRKEDRTPPAP